MLRSMGLQKVRHNLVTEKPPVTVNGSRKACNPNWRILPCLVQFGCWYSYFLLYLPKFSVLPQNDTVF